ncbi:MAG TPA: hypothetical protein VGF34_21070 [Stellaceae bacterium]|jgi:hypothetical protein
MGDSINEYIGRIDQRQQRMAALAALIDAVTGKIFLPLIVERLNLLRDRMSSGHQIDYARHVLPLLSELERATGELREFDPFIAAVKRAFLSTTA